MPSGTSKVQIFNAAGDQVKNPGGSNTAIGFYCIEKVEFFGPTI